MKIKVLGSSGSEAPGHNLPAFLIDEFMLLDAGTITRELGQREQRRITHILLSHAHLDHIRGIPFLADNMAVSNNGSHVTVVGAKEVLAALRENIFNGRIWPDFTAIPNRAKAIMKYRHLPVRGFLDIVGYRIFAAKVNHPVPAYGYLIEDPHNRCLAYTGDTGPTDELWKAMNRRRVDALIVEVSFPDEMVDIALASGHMTPSLLKQELQKMRTLPRFIYVSHIKPFYRETIERQLPELRGVTLAIIEDGMVISV